MKNKILFSGCLSVVVLSVFGFGSAFAQTNTVAAHPTEYDGGPLPSAGLEETQFSWWAPANTQIRGVLVLIPGRGMDGRGLVKKANWQALADKTQFGIMGCRLANKKDEPYKYQFDPNGVVSERINNAINKLLIQNGQSIKNPPLAFWGHSAGGNVTQSYASRHASRVIAAVLCRATSGPGSLAPGKLTCAMNRAF